VKPPHADQPPEADGLDGSGNALDGQDSDPSGPATSRSSQISTPSPSAESVPDGDTLLSAPAPAAKWETDFEDRLGTACRLIDDLDDRVRVLEERARQRNSETGTPRAFWWVAFLVALAVLWQLGVWLRGR
jgi:hypothetical protein